MKTNCYQLSNFAFIHNINQKVNLLKIIQIRVECLFRLFGLPFAVTVFRILESAKDSTIIGML